MCCDLPDVRGRHVVLGVTGGIAVYKSCEIVSRLRKLGVETHVIMTKNAAQFVQPLTFETLSNHPVVTDTFARPGETRGCFCHCARDGEYHGEDGVRHCGRYAVHHRLGNESADSACPCHEYWHVDGGGDAAERADLESPRRAFCRAGSGLFGVRRYGRGPHECRKPSCARLPPCSARSAISRVCVCW